MSPPAVAIVVPCCARNRNQLEHLDETLASVDAQTHRNYELVVVDDGSPEAVPGLVSRHPQARCVRQGNAGPAVARNTGFAATSADHVVFLDSDDHLLPCALEVGLAALAAHPDCGFTVGAREEMTYEGSPVGWAVPPPPAGASNIYAALLGFEWYIIPPSSAMFRREVVETVGGFRDPWGADDLDFYLRAARDYQAFCFSEPPVTRYRRYSTSTSRDGERMLHSIRLVYERQRPAVTGHPEDERAYEEGLRRLVPIFVDCLVENIGDRMRTGDYQGAQRSARVLAREAPHRYHALVDADPETARILGATR